MLPMTIPKMKKIAAIDPFFKLFSTASSPVCLDIYILGYSSPYPAFA
jgi:hypothetical protein